MGHTPPPEAEGELRVVDIRGEDRLAMAGDIGLTWSSNGERIIAATEYGVVLIWSASTGELERHIDLGTHIEYVKQVILSPNDEWIVVVGDSKLTSWDAPKDA
jgi:WD40 repeat protein